MENYYGEVKEGDLINFMYTNWKGVLSKRQAIIKGFLFGANDYHPEYQFFIIGFDLDKLEYRHFAVKDISAIKVIKH
jgi:hypothetical protein